MLAEAPGASEAFHERLLAVRRPLLSVPVAFHMLTLLPDHGMLTDQPLMEEELVFVTVRSIFRPVPQSEVTLTPTVIAALDEGALVAVELGDDVGVGVDVAVGDGAMVGAAVGVGVGVAMGAGAGIVVSAGAPTIEQVPAGITQIVGARAPPRGAPRKPKVVLAPLASEGLQFGPAKR
jgi:hypothetical protein